MQDDNETREWLRGVMRHTGMKATPLAKAAGLAPSTLLRALDNDDPSTLERRSIKKISEQFNVPTPGHQACVGFSEPELLAYTPPAAALGKPAPLTHDQYHRVINTRSLSLMGCLPGDVLTLDMSVEPQDGDIVDAQVYALQRGNAETVLRLYDKPYLVTRTGTGDGGGNAKPLLVDTERVRIAAVAVHLERIMHRLSH